MAVIHYYLNDSPHKTECLIKSRSNNSYQLIFKSGKKLDVRVCEWNATTQTLFFEIDNQCYAAKVLYNPNSQCYTSSLVGSQRSVITKVTCIPSSYNQSNTTQSSNHSSSPCIKSPIAGRVTKIFAQIGDLVAPNQPLVSIESMKMDNIICFSSQGTIISLHAKLHDIIRAGDLLAELRLD